MDFFSTTFDLILYYFCISVLIVNVLLCVIHFHNHFVFRILFPFVAKNADATGVYPSIFLVHIWIFVGLYIIVLVGFWNNNNFVYDPLLPQCSDVFDVANDNISKNRYNSYGNMTIYIYYTFIFLLSLSLLIEIYFSYSRYAGTASLQGIFGNRAFMNDILPFIIYSIIFYILLLIDIFFHSQFIWMTLILTVFHFGVNLYFSYFFYQSVKLSFANVITVEGLF